MTYQFPGVALKTTVNIGDVPQWDGSDWVPAAIGTGGGFGTQAAWFINSATGDDNNDGLTAGTAIATLGELTRRIGNATIQQDTTITIVGTFAEFLELNSVVEQGFTLTIVGEMATAFSSTIDAFTNLNAATSTPASLVDATMTAATHVQRRFVMTGGAAVGALGWGLLNTGANTMRMSQFTTVAGVASNPGMDDFDIQTFSTSIQGYSLNIGGGGNVAISDISFAVPASEVLTEKCGGLLTFTGCQWTTSPFTAYCPSPTNTYIACSFQQDMTVRKSQLTLTGCAVFNDLIATDETVINFDPSPTCFQTGGKLTISKNSTCDMQTNLGFFDTAAAGVDAALSVLQSSNVNAVTNAIVWTAGTPAQANGVRVTSNSHVNYVTKFTGVGVTNETVIGGAVVNYAAVPFINPANNASMVVAA